MKQIGCHHVWKLYHSFDKTMNRFELYKCDKCEMILKKELINNMKPLNCPVCHKFVAWAEEIAGNHPDDIKCLKCGSIAIKKSFCVIGPQI